MSKTTTGSINLEFLGSRKRVPVTLLRKLMLEELRQHYRRLTAPARLAASRQAYHTTLLLIGVSAVCQPSAWEQPRHRCG
jgi:hypothetical protein